MSALSFIARRVLTVLAVASLSACAGHADRTLEARSALDAGRPRAALELYNEELDVSSAKELPKDVGGDNALLGHLGKPTDDLGVRNLRHRGRNDTRVEQEPPRHRSTSRPSPASRAASKKPSALPASMAWPPRRPSLSRCRPRCWVGPREWCSGWHWWPPRWAGSPRRSCARCSSAAASGTERAVELPLTPLDYLVRARRLFPEVDPDEALREYEIELCDEPSPNSYDAVILAVAHSQFLPDSGFSLRSLLKPSGVVFDVKGVLPTEKNVHRL